MVAAPPPSALLTAVFCAIVAGAVTLATLLTYPRRETVSGWIVPDRGLVRLTAEQGGFVETLSIQEGSVISAGEEVARIRLSQIVSSGDAGQAAIAGMQREQEAASQRAEATTAQLEAETHSAREALLTLRSERSETQRRIELQIERLEIAEIDAQRAAEIAARGYMSRRDLEQRQAAALETQQDLAEMRQRKLEYDRQISALAARLIAIPLESAAAHAGAGVEGAQIEQRLADAQARSAYVVRSPIAGRVGATPMAQNQFARPGGTIATILPEGSVLEAELYVPSRAAGFIEPGQQVRLLFQAFPHQRFGAGHGTVSSVSSTVLAPDEVAILGARFDEPVFRVKVMLEREFIEAYGERYALRPGMLLTADILVDRRTLIGWLFDPLLAAARR